MYPLEFSGILAAFVVLLWGISRTSSPIKTGTAIAVILSITLSSVAQPSLAAAANDDALSDAQKALNESLRTDPQGIQYEGIEYPQVNGTPLSDREITARIYNQAPDNLKVSVSSGAVRLSGVVENQRVAKKIVKNVREIPGVHEVSYDLATAK